jgi:hypothetical protein
MSLETISIASRKRLGYALMRWTGVKMKKLIAVTLFACIAACGQTTTKHKPAVAAQTGWTKYELKDEITDKITTSFYVSSLPPEKATLLIVCRAEGPYVTINPHFQISYDSDGYHRVTIPIRTDDVASQITRLSLAILTIPYS